MRIQHQPIVQHDHGKGGQLQFNKADEDKADLSRNDIANIADEMQNIELGELLFYICSLYVCIVNECCVIHMHCAHAF